ncbi:MAG: metallophosphoesterase [Chloroflexi bacterium]|nr:MAG: metallophosphoesterase [Chloroflexota bacterium]
MLHHALVLSDRLSRLPGPAIGLLLLLIAAASGQIWGDRPPTAPWIAGLTFLSLLGDWTMLALLPRTGRSYGPVQPPLLGLASLRLLLTALSAGLSAPFLLLIALNLALSGLAFYATWVEPFRLDVTHVEVRSPRLSADAPPLRLLHLTDLHLERFGPRERHLLRLVEDLHPDLILITGDFLNLSFREDPTAQAEARRLLGHLRAPGGVYAVTGSPTVDLPHAVEAVLQGSGVTWLRDESHVLEVKGHRLRLIGLSCTHDLSLDAPRLAQALNGQETERFTILLYHSPDLMPQASRMGVDLYLAGHTHGGQIRAPLFGAILTSSVHWKRYEMGLYREGRTTLYVSRGIGLEGAGAPRARFLCPPEITLFTLRAGADHAG